jgi:hypothetical protein
LRVKDFGKSINFWKPGKFYQLEKFFGKPDFLEVKNSDNSQIFQKTEKFWQMGFPGVKNFTTSKNSDKSQKFKQMEKF